MKLAKTGFDCGVTAAAERQMSTKQDRNRVELDDELFLPAAATARGGDRPAPKHLAHRDSAPDSASWSGSSRRPAGPSSPAIAGAQRNKRRIESSPPRAGSATGKPSANSGYIQHPDLTVDADGRRWPTLSPAPPDLKRELENKIKELSAELAQRHAQIADLCNLRYQRDSELQEARNVMDSVENSIALLQSEIEKHASEASAARQALALSKKENAALRMQLDKAKGESAAALKRSLKVEAEFNDREVAVASARETVEFLRRDLAAKAAEARNLRETIKELNRRHCDELNKKDMNLKIHIKKFEVALAERDMQIKAIDKAHSKLIERYNNLASNMDALEGSGKISGEKSKNQNELVELLETLLRAEREAAALKIQELTAELERERSDRSAVNRGTAAAQKDTALFTPNFAARRSRAYAHELESSISQTNAA